MTRYFTTHGNGNLGNQLYYALQAEALSARTGDSWRFVPTGYSLKCGFPESARNLNIGCYLGDGTPEMSINDSYLQEFGKHFSILDLEKFLSCTMMDVSLDGIDSPNDRERDILVVIRNGDYLLPQYDKFNYFDRTLYLRTALERIPQDRKVGTLCVSSEDTGLCERLYGVLFARHFGDRVRYLPVVEPWKALLRNSLYRNQILTNTTFGYWGAFLSNMRYPNSVGRVIVPWGFSTDEMNGNRNSPYWYTIDCPVVRGR